MKRTFLIIIIILLIIVGFIWFFIPSSDDDSEKSIENPVKEPIKIDTVFQSVEIYKETVHKNVFDLEVYFFDVSALKFIDPSYNGNPTYTGSVYVVDYKSKTIKGPFSTSSTFPNSKEHNSIETHYNTVLEGGHIFNNRSGHNGSDSRGLNLVLQTGLPAWEGRYSLGFDDDGKPIMMNLVNVHAGTSDLGNHNSRGSHGCLTIKPSDTLQFFKQFGMENKTTGDLEGAIYVFRNDNQYVVNQILAQIESEIEDVLEDEPSEVDSNKVIVVETIPKDLNQGQKILSNARIGLSNQKELDFKDEISGKRELAKLLRKFKRSKKVTKKEMEEFLKIDPSLLKNYTELSQMYNEALVNVVKHNRIEFASQLVVKPILSRQISFDLMNPVNDAIAKDFSLDKTLSEYQNQINTRINELEDKDLIMQYNLEKKLVLNEFENIKIDIITPQNIQEINQEDIRGFEGNYKIENRIPDREMELGQVDLNPSDQPVDNTQIDIDNFKVDLNKVKTDNELDRAKQQLKLKELQEINNIKELQRSGGNQ